MSPLTDSVDRALQWTWLVKRATTAVMQQEILDDLRTIDPVAARLIEQGLLERQWQQSTKERV